jgi:NAD(P)-dependent dehydrogenase (short-subunit alcohol dehydrogenase family)
MTQRVLITGGGSGLGRVVCEAFLARGAHVHVCDISTDALAEVEEWAKLAKCADRFRGSHTDIGDPEGTRKLLAEAIAWLEHVDVLINNVGVPGPRAAIEEVSETEWMASLQANLLGAIRCIQAVLPDMKARRAGVIISISTSSVCTRPLSRSPYVVSKAALEAVSGVVAREAGLFGVRSNVIRPGLMDNARMRRVLGRIAKEKGCSLEEVIQGELQYVSMRSVINMQEVADMVLFLASDQARHITGQIIAVDGGAEWEH